LDNSVIELHEEDLMICDGESNGMCIAGVYGGAKSGVKNETTAIFLESAYFDPKSIRRTSTRHGLRTDAATHFEKGIDPAVTETALLRAVQLISELANGEVASEVYKLESKTFEPFNVSLEYKNIKRLTGADISKEDTKKILDLLEMKIASENETTLGVARSALSNRCYPRSRCDRRYFTYLWFQQCGYSNKIECQRQFLQILRRR
jgi:phenylalanyl-tRNA synthetase beta chain